MHYVYMAYVAVIVIMAMILTTPVGYAADAVGDSTAQVLTPLGINQTQDLSFGKFVAGTVTGAVSVSAAGTFGQNVSIVVDGTRGSFAVTGEPNTSFFVTSPPFIILSSGPNSMFASLFTPVIDSLDGGGTQTIFIDGVLTVAANQSPGVYTGAYLVSVNY